jgi:hypothetical protein
VKYKTILISLLILACLGIFVLLFLKSRVVVKPGAGPEGKIAWREDFKTTSEKEGSSLPENWELEKKPGTPPAVFSVVKDEKSGISFLRMKADKASASLVTKVNNLNIQDVPIMKWRWRVDVLPAGADGRKAEKDDQAVGIYVGTGSMLNNKSISYRWDTDTPEGAEGNCAYGGGTIKVKWFTLRNAEDAKDGEWYVEKRNVAEDFKNAWGFYPGKIYISISCNSQYTGTEAEADINWIELTSDPDGEETTQETKQ